MTRKTINWLAVILVLGQLLAGMVILIMVKPDELHMVEVNELLQICALKWEELEQGKQDSMPESIYRYAVLDGEGRVLYMSVPDMPDNLHEALQHKDIAVDIIAKGQVIGKLIIDNETEKKLQEAGKSLVAVLFVGTAISILAMLLYTSYLNKTILKPFEEMRTFAVRVAGGNLDLPLNMDRKNAFGAFTESFDLMREELKKAKEQERIAQQSKKELVAKLSHDIKTPVASIKAVAEVMAVLQEDEKVRKQLAVIESKADQIDALISNMFHAALEELEQLTTLPKEQESLLLPVLAEAADYQNKAVIGEVPASLVWFDTLRLQQVLDNIVANSYKYADTPLEITFSYEADRMLIRCRDYGKGVPEEELPLLFHKFYRGKNAGEKSGAGLGLYISRHLVTQMGGEMECENLPDGFCVSVKLKI